MAIRRHRGFKEEIQRLECRLVGQTTFLRKPHIATRAQKFQAISFSFLQFHSTLMEFDPSIKSFQKLFCSSSLLIANQCFLPSII